LQHSSVRCPIVALFGECSVCVALGTKRKFSEDVGVIREEMWSLRDVIFTETVQTVKLGTVVKVDGCYMAVHYPALDVGTDISQADLANCRLLRRDELVVSDWDTCTTQPHHIYM